MIEDYDLGQIIGKGGFAEVFRARHRGIGREVALKIIRKSKIADPKMNCRIQNEVKIHKMLQHKCIAKLLDSFEDEHSFYLVLELCHLGNLFKYLKLHGPLSEFDSFRIVLQLLDTLQYLEFKQIIHRDLKLSNVLLVNEENMDIMICDFGLAIQVSHPDEEHFTFCGTPNYIAPEIASQSSYGFPADLWAIGCLFFSLLTGIAPFENKEINDTLNRVRTGDYQIPNTVSKEAADFIQSLLQKDPLQRGSVSEMLGHPFIRKYTAETSVTKPSETARRHASHYSPSQSTSSSRNDDSLDLFAVPTTNRQKTASYEYWRTPRNEQTRPPYRAENEEAAVRRSLPANIRLQALGPTQFNRYSEPDRYASRGGHHIKNHDIDHQIPRKLSYGEAEDHSMQSSSMGVTYGAGNPHTNSSSFRRESVSRSNHQSHSHDFASTTPQSRISHATEHSPRVTITNSSYRERTMHRDHPLSLQTAAGSAPNQSLLNRMFDDFLVRSSCSSDHSHCSQSLVDLFDSSSSVFTSSEFRAQKSHHSPHKMQIPYSSLHHDAGKASEGNKIPSNHHQSSSDSTLFLSNPSSQVPLLLSRSDSMRVQSFQYVSSRKEYLTLEGSRRLMYCRPIKSSSRSASRSTSHPRRKYIRVLIFDDQPLCVYVSKLDRKQRKSLESELKTPRLIIGEQESQQPNYSFINTSASFLNQEYFKSERTTESKSGGKNSSRDPQLLWDTTKNDVKKYHLSQLPDLLRSIYLHVYRLLEVVNSRIPRLVLYLQPESKALSVTTSNNPLKSSSAGQSGVSQVKKQRDQSDESFARESEDRILRCKCVLMSNRPVPDCLVQWADGSKLKYSFSTKKIIFFENLLDNNANESNNRCGEREGGEGGCTEGLSHRAESVSTVGNCDYTNNPMERTLCTTTSSPSLHTQSTSRTLNLYPNEDVRPSVSMQTAPLESKTRGKNAATTTPNIKYRIRELDINSDGSNVLLESSSFAMKNYLSVAQYAVQETLKLTESSHTHFSNSLTDGAHRSGFKKDSCGDRNKDIFTCVIPKEILLI